MSRQPRSDRGVALIVVLFLSAMLTLIMYAFLRDMQVEHALATTYGSERQAEQLAWSAIDRGIASLLADTSGATTLNTVWYENRDEWYEIELADQDGEVAGVYSLVRPGDQFGVVDEASKVNLNTVTRDMLLRLPLVTEEIADSILDWRDADDTPTRSGGENTYYQALQPGYRCKNAAFDTVDELLLVKGVTRDILYGEDTNANGRLDPHEDDGDATLPKDDSDGVLDSGLASFVTVWSADRNVRSNGQPRVNINTATSAQLTEALGDVLSPGQINAIITRRPLVAAAVQQPGYRSGADLMTMAGVAPPGLTPELYRQIADRVTVLDGAIPGQINVNTAPRQVLATLPGLSAEDLDAILEHRSAEGANLSSVAWLTEVLTPDKVQAAVPWLTVRSWQFRFDAVGRVGPKSTLEPSDFGAKIDDPNSPPRVMRRLLAVFDRAADRPRLVYFRDISGLGMPYPVEETR